jgi:hypothetical protein
MLCACPTGESLAGGPWTKHSPYQFFFKEDFWSFRATSSGFVLSVVAWAKSEALAKKAQRSLMRSTFSLVSLLAQGHCCAAMAVWARILTHGLYQRSFALGLSRGTAGRDGPPGRPQLFKRRRVRSLDGAPGGHARQITPDSLNSKGHWYYSNDLKADIICEADSVMPANPAV